MKKVGIVVVNYKNCMETINCIESLLMQEKVTVHIAVVDNGSNNESLSILTEQYEHCENVSVLNSKVNLGYAKGNNIGISFLKSKGYDFIFVANSDIWFSKEDILSSLLDNYETGVGIIVPIIKNSNGTIDQRVAHMKKYLYLRILRKMYYILADKRFPDNLNNVEGSVERTKRLLGFQKDRYVISGSGFMLTKEFTDIYKGLYPETFLYCEEWATILLLKKAHLFTKIAKCAPIIHKGAASTPDDVKNMTEVRKKIMQRSARKIIKLLIMPSFVVRKRY